MLTWNDCRLMQAAQVTESTDRDELMRDCQRPRDPLEPKAADGPPSAPGVERSGTLAKAFILLCGKSPAETVALPFALGRGLNSS